MLSPVWSSVPAGRPNWALLVRAAGTACCMVCAVLRYREFFVAFAAIVDQFR
jgi:hypothetical protein